MLGKGWNILGLIGALLVLTLAISNREVIFAALGLCLVVVEVCEFYHGLSMETKAKIKDYLKRSHFVP